jgi:hypothetical protein
LARKRSGHSTARHAGFGLGFERTPAYVIGIANIGGRSHSLARLGCNILAVAGDIHDLFF